MSSRCGRPLRCVLCPTLNAGDVTGWTAIMSMTIVKTGGNGLGPRERAR